MSDAPSLAGILLAAGASSRLGRPKQLVVIGGRSLVRRAAEYYLGIDTPGLELLSLTVVSGHAAGEVSEQLVDLPVRVEFYPGWSSGMGASLAFGAGLVPRRADGVVVLLCDQWRLDPSRLSYLARCWLTDISNICCSQWKQGSIRNYGAPSIFPRKYIHELKYIEKDHGAKSIIDRYHGSTRFAQIDEAGLDVDSEEDLAVARKTADQA